jgi:Mn2+/Fe2+ NRAMP family transporter
MIIAGFVVLLPGINIFHLVIVTQSINAMILPLVFYYLIKLSSSTVLMKEYVNTKFQKYFSIIATVVIIVASVLTLVTTFIHI